MSVLREGLAKYLRATEAGKAGLWKMTDAQWRNYWMSLRRPDGSLDGEAYGQAIKDKETQGLDAILRVISRTEWMDFEAVVKKLPRGVELGFVGGMLDRLKTQGRVKTTSKPAGKDVIAGIIGAPTFYKRG